MIAAPILVTVAEAANLLALSPARVYGLANDGVLEKRYIGKGTRNYRLTYDSLVDYANGLSHDPAVSA